ncbi:MAG: transcriptional regulator [Clostridiaceae bacterium]
MDKNLKEDYIQCLFRFKKSGFGFPKSSELNMKELFVMAGLTNNIYGVDTSVDLSEVQSHTHITKAAISQMFSSLEKRGYVIRETDKTNRRKITVVLTPEGEAVLKRAKEETEVSLDEMLLRLGTENAKQLITLITQLSDIADEINQERQMKQEQEDSSHGKA